MVDVGNTLPALRRAFFARRNGVVADTLRRGGTPHTYIMGCPLAELKQLAADYPHDADLARALWADREHRECRLMATLLYPATLMTHDEALAWATDARCTEEADVLCHSMLRHVADARGVAENLTFSGTGLKRYCGLRLLLNLQVCRQLPHDDALNRRLTQLCEQDPTIDTPQRHLIQQLLDD